MEVMTIVSGRLPDSMTAKFEAAYDELGKGPIDEGLVRSALLRKCDTTGVLYKIETLWESREALAKMRSGPQPPKAPQLFLMAGVQPSFEVFDMVEQIPPTVAHPMPRSA
jgi:hypothetical protein